MDGSDPVVREFFGEDVPPVRELIKNTSLVLLNRHVSIHAARPVTPNLVHVGGLHLRVSIATGNGNELSLHHASNARGIGRSRPALRSLWAPSCRSGWTRPSTASSSSRWARG